MIRWQTSPEQTFQEAESAAHKLVFDFAQTITAVFAILDDHLTRHHCDVITFRLNNQPTAVVWEIVQVVRLTRRQLLVVNDIQVRVSCARRNVGESASVN